MNAVPRRLLVLGGGPVGVEMAQAVRRLGGEVALVEGAAHLLAREPAPLGEALGEALRRDGIELNLASTRRPHAARARSTSLTLDDGRELRGDRLLVATGRRPRVAGRPGDGRRDAGQTGVPVDSRLRAGERLWAVGDVPASGCSPTSASTRARSLRRTSSASRARPITRPCRASSTPTLRPPRSVRRGPVHGDGALSEVAKTATYTHAYAESTGFLALLSDGERLTGAYALGPEAGEWLQQATLAIRARVPLAVLRDTIQPFPTFSEIYVAALKALRGRITAGTGPR